MRKILRPSRWVATVASVTVGVGLLTGCAPSVQPLPPNQAQGTVDPSGWAAIRQSVDASATSSMFDIKSEVDFTEGTLKTSYTTYGSINLPQTINLSLHEQNFNVRYYQQGQVAYEFSDNAWVEAPPLSNMDVLAGYHQLVSSVPATSVVVYQLPPQFVVTEYCDIYKVVIPSQYVKALIGWSKNSQVHNTSDVVYTFAVGQDSGLLDEVTTNSVGEVQSVGPVQISSDTELFDYNKPQALVKIPGDLVDKLS